jgi:D-alanyl-D-alanine carboxypeptidase
VVRGKRAVGWLLALCMLAAGAAPAAHAGPLGQEGGEPEIGARAAIVVEYPSGRILYSKAMHDRLAPASTTKILTAILALEHGKLDDVVTTDAGDLVGESTMGLEVGEQQTLHNLLYGLLLPSGNDAAMAIARYIGSQVTTPNPALNDPIDRFTEMMDVRVAQLGLQDTHFVNPHGLDADGHYSSAYDLASLTWYALHLSVFNEVVGTAFYQAPGHPLRNTNEMLSRYAGSDGVKTGWTDAGGLCLVTTATRDGHRLISVVLNAPHWYSDSAAVLDYGFAQLAAKPDPGGAEVLSVARRGTVSWLLVNSAQAPAMPAVAGQGQGGGVQPLAVADKPAAVSAPPREQPAQAAADAGGTNSSLALDIAPSQALVLAPQQPVSDLLWVLALFGLVGLAICWLLATRLWRVSLRWFRPAALAPALAPAVSYPSPAPAGQERVRAPVARTLGSPPLHRRREPNLLVTPEEAAQHHLERAVALAGEGRQGSSMAEFLLAMRLGQELHVDQLDAGYDLTSSGFLALARAQAAAGMPDAARQTLQYAVSALPGDRLLQLAYYQLRGR